MASNRANAKKSPDDDLLERIFGPLDSSDTDQPISETTEGPPYFEILGACIALKIRLDERSEIDLNEENRIKLEFELRRDKWIDDNEDQDVVDKAFKFASEQLARSNSFKQETPPFPDAATKLYKENKKAYDGPVDFIEKEYGTWINNGLTWSSLYKVDKNLYFTLNMHERKYGLPSNWNMPRRKALTEEQLSSVDMAKLEPSAKLYNALRLRAYRARKKAGTLDF